MQHARILFVDDEPNVTEALKRTLRREPYEIFTANSAAEALALLAANDVDVVVSDERMPGTPGSAFLGQVRRARPDTVRIILSGQASLEDVVRAVNEGEIYRFCMKPINAVELGLVIRQALQQKRLLDLSRSLLRAYRRQSARLERMQRLHPAITQLDRDADGAIVLDEDRDEHMDLESVVREIEATMG